MGINRHIDPLKREIEAQQERIKELENKLADAEAELEKAKKPKTRRKRTTKKTPKELEATDVPETHNADGLEIDKE